MKVDSWKYVRELNKLPQILQAIMHVQMQDRARKRKKAASSNTRVWTWTQASSTIHSATPIAEQASQKSDAESEESD